LTHNKSQPVICSISSYRHPNFHGQHLSTIFSVLRTEESPNTAVFSISQGNNSWMQYGMAVRVAIPRRIHLKEFPDYFAHLPDKITELPVAYPQSMAPDIPDKLHEYRAIRLR
jgi:hypothetical protein